MKDIPIIFSSPMVLALLAGRKTMTRRLVPYGSSWMRVLPNDRLWVREGFCKLDRDHRPPPFAYMADTPQGSEGDAIRKQYGYKWKPSIHMPRIASRLTLAVTAVKIEPLQNISEDDAMAEGAIFHDGHGVGHSGWRHFPEHGYVYATARDSFAWLWGSLHGLSAWGENPEVVALTFTVHKTNIDAMPNTQAA